MGPVILFDKSTLQTLSQDEEGFLFKHYFVAVSPILVMEIIGDLAKSPQEGFSRSDAQWLASKMSPVGSAVCVHYRKPMVASLLGGDVPMEGRVMIDPDTAVDVPGPRGTKGVVIEEPPEQKALRHWAQGTFNDQERMFAAIMRQRMNEPTLEEFRKSNPPKEKDIRNAKTLPELFQIVDRSLRANDKDVQFKLIQACLKRVGASEALKTRVSNRWIARGLPRFAEFAPYAFYCWEVYATFIMAISKGLLPTKTNSILDLEYLYYLPFCQVFSSKDKLHREMVQLFLRKDQEFVDGADLKADLKWLAEDWASLTDQQKEQRREAYGSYPPEKADSVTHRMWTRFCKPRSGKQVPKLTEEQERAIVEEINRKMEPYHRMRRARGEA